jgi:hypothetical protein
MRVKMRLPIGCRGYLASGQCNWSTYSVALLQPSVESRCTVARENINIVEKAKRLIALCRECSRDNKRKAPVWLSHVRSGCGLESEYPSPTDREIKQRGGEYKLVYPSHDVFVERFCFIDGGDIIDSVHECLESYSDLIVEKTKYDAMEVWQRGLSLLAEYCADKREVYWIVKREDKPPFPKHFLFESLELLKRQKEDIFYPQYEFVRDCEDSGTPHDICSIPSTVYNAWIENPDNRWVILWKNIFRDIESATQPLTIKSIKPDKPVKKLGGWTKQEIVEHVKDRTGCWSSSSFVNVREKSKVPSSESGGRGQQRRYTDDEIEELALTVEDNDNNFRDGIKIAKALRELK